MINYLVTLFPNLTEILALTCPIIFKSHPELIVQNSSYDQFDDYHYVAGGRGINHFIFSNLVIVAMMSFSRTNDRCNIMTGQHREYMAVKVASRLDV